MAMTLTLRETFSIPILHWHAQVLHDLHESVPFLYDNTVGDGPYNAWVDPTLADEWAELGWNNVAQMQRFGMPGVFTHGDFDTWSPGYLMFLAGMHNGISRLYETFGNGGADTEKRILRAGRLFAHLVPTESAAAGCELVATGQQQLRRKRVALHSLLLRKSHSPFPRELLPQEQARRSKAYARRPGGLRDPSRCQPRPIAKSSC